MTSEDYGKNLKRRRALAGKSQAQVADRIGCDRAYVSMVEAGFRNFTKDDERRVDDYLRREGAKRVQELQSVFATGNATVEATA